MRKRNIIFLVAILIVLSLFVGANEILETLSGGIVVRTVEQPRSWNITKTGAETNLDVTYNFVDNTTTEFCIDVRNMGAYLSAVAQQGNNPSEVPISEVAKAQAFSINKNKIDLSAPTKRCFEVNYDDWEKEMEFKIGWNSVLIVSQGGALPWADLSSTNIYGAYENLGQTMAVKKSDDDLYLGVKLELRDLYFYNSSDAGTNWYDNSPSDQPRTDDHNLLIDSKGNFFLTAINYTDGTFLLYNSTDDGATWSSRQRLLDSVQIVDTSSCIMDANDVFHCCTADSTNSSLYYHNSSDKQDYEIVSNRTGYGSESYPAGCNIEVDRRGCISVLTNVGEVDGNADTLYHWNTCEDSFGYEQGTEVATDRVTGYSLAIDRENNIHISFTRWYSNAGLYHSVSKDGGDTWVETQLNSGSFNGANDIAVSDNGEIYILVEDVNDNIKRYNSSDGGATWENTNLHTGIFSNQGIKIIDNNYPKNNTLTNKLNYFYTNTTLVGCCVDSSEVYMENFSVYFQTYPIFFIDNPINNSFLNSNESVALNYVVDINADNYSECLYSLDDLVTNVTLTKCSNTEFNITEGFSNITLWANDTNGNTGQKQYFFTTDITYPAIDFSATTEINNSNFTRDSIFSNVTITETNLATVSFYLFDSSFIQLNETSYTDGTTEINFTGLSDGLYYYNVTAVDNASNSNSTETRIIRLDNSAPSIDITEPQAQVYSNNESLEMNFTVIDNLLDATCWYNVVNVTSGLYDVSNDTITNCGNTTFNVSAEGTYNFTLYANDTLGNQNESSVVFSVSLSAPAVVLNYPTDVDYLASGQNVTLNFTATDGDGITQCQVWHNQSGTFEVNQTITGITSAQLTNSSELNFTHAENILWNVNCSDPSGNSGFALNNFTFIVDEEDPVVTITQPTGDKSSFTGIPLQTTTTDLTPTTCIYRIEDRAGVQLLGNTSVSCSASTTFDLSSHGLRTIIFFAEDSAGNLVQEEQNFSTTAPAGTVEGGGGGGGTIIIENGENKTDCNIEFIPETVSVSISRRLAELKIKNLEAFSFDPTLEIRSIDGEKSYRENLELTKIPGRILENQEVSLGVRYNGESIEPGRNHLVLSSDVCNEILVDINVNKEDITLLFENIFDPDKNLIENFLDLFFGSLFKFEPLLFLKFWMVFLLMTLILGFFIITRTIKNTKKGEKTLALLNVVVILIISLSLTFMLKIAFSFI